MAAPARSLVRIAPLVSQVPASSISPAPPLQNGRDLYPPTPLSPSPSRHRRSWPPPSHYYYYDPPPPGTENVAARYGMLSIFLIVLFGMLVMVCAAARRGCSPRTDRSRLERERAATAQQASASSRPPASTTVLRQAPAALDSATIQALPLFGYRRTTPEEGFPDVARIKGHGDCPVCLAEFSEGEMVRLMPNCLHVFHPHCIDPWLLAHPSCPICREPVHASKSSRATT